MSLTSPALAGSFFTTSSTWEACIYIYIYRLQYKPIKISFEKEAIVWEALGFSVILFQEQTLSTSHIPGVRDTMVNVTVL